MGKLNQILAGKDTDVMVRLEKGEIILSPLDAEERRKSVEILEDEIVARLSKVDLTELLIEVDSWIHFTAHFKHAGGTEPRSKELLTHI